jgi:diguanylate cyclase (GGDEF)-like protein
VDPPLANIAATAAEQKLVAELGPLAAPGRLRRLAPFAGLIVCLLVSLAFDSGANRMVFRVLAVASALATITAALTPWRRLPRRAQAAVIILPLFLVAGLMRGDDGLNSQVLVIILVPLFWLAIYESLRSLLIGLGVTVVIIGAELVRLPPLDDVMRGITTLAVALTLMPALRHLVATNRAALVAITDMAGHDSLTGLANRRGVTMWLDDARHDHSPGLALIFVDVNRFKRINDTFGHDAGDDLLVAIGQRISAAIRASDVAARVGGDEFIIASNCSRSVAEDLADRVRRAIAETPFQVRDQQVLVAASVGMSHLSHQPEDIGAMLDDADHAMYRAKESGKTEH